LIKTKRIYNDLKGADDNSFRILVDRLWPRGLGKDQVKIDHWEKDIAPSNPLRKWFRHDEDKWIEFKRRYFKELENNSDSVHAIIDKIKEHEGSVTLLFGAKNENLNNATALKEFLEKRIKK
jgi:uncharacterized protein YeaO (DUF488 family)